MSHPVEEGGAAIPFRTGIAPGFGPFLPRAGPPARPPSREPAVKERRRARSDRRAPAPKSQPGELAYGKLVRDLVPELLERNGKRVASRVVPREERFERLVGLIVQGARQISKRPTVSEFAEMVEVIRALCDLSGIDMKNVERERLQKRDKRGGYGRGIVLDKVVG